MRRNFRHAVAVFAALAGAFLTGNVSATSQRTFVASTGLDANPCSISAPCRSFSAAIAKTSSNGEVIVLDSAGYGPVTIAKSISLIAPAGIYAGVTVFSGAGITVNGPGIFVLLRGLSISGQGGVNGINVLDAVRLRIENCVISGMTSDGILHGTSGTSELIVVETSIRNNQGNGIDFLSAGIVVLDHVRSEDNMFDGLSMLSLSNGLEGSITESVLARNGRHGINVQTSTVDSTPHVLVDRSVLEYNGGAGFVIDGASAFSLASVTRNAIHRNSGDGVRVLGGGGGTLVTVSGNTFDGNNTGIRSDGAAAWVDVSANAMRNQDFAFEQANGAFFGSYRNNVAATLTTGTISTLSGN